MGTSIVRVIHAQGHQLRFLISHPSSFDEDRLPSFVPKRAIEFQFNRPLATTYRVKLSFSAEAPRLVVLVTFPLALFRRVSLIEAALSAAITTEFCPYV